MLNKTVAELSADLAAGSCSSEELTRYYLNRIEQHDPLLNSFITVCEEQALAAARAADARIQSGDAGPLTGIPFAHKDLFCTDGVLTTCASRMLDNFVAPYDATVTSLLKQAGAVMLGKTNMDEFAMGSTNESSYYGACRNPWNPEHVPGGSSGGSASAVAARLAPIATGTDTGGSIRQPSSFCGITGIKPTYGRVSRFGMIAFASSLDQGGVMASSAEDAASMLGIIAGHDVKDSTSASHPGEDYREHLQDSLDGLRIGIPREYFDERLDSRVATVIEAALKELESLGASLKQVSLPNMALSIPAYYVIAPAECSSNLSRFDGVRFGHRCKDPVDLNDLYSRSRAEGFGSEVQRRILIGTFALSAGYYDAYYLQAQKVRRLIANDFATALQEVDVIAAPAAPSTAPLLGSLNHDPVQMYLSDIYTLSLNLAGLPGMSIPAGIADGMPVGMQLIGDFFTESRLLNVAHRFQQATDWHRNLPSGYAD